MKTLDVIFVENERAQFKVGQLIEVKEGVFFEYDEEFIDKGFELSPFFLPLKSGAFEHTDREFGPIWGLFDDSLPDGWGLLLLNRYLRKSGKSFSSFSILDKLAWLGSSTMGALTYFPPENEEKFSCVLDLQKVYENTKEIMSGSESDVLPELLKAGGSPGGARPKVLVGYNPEEKKILTGENSVPAGYEHWLVKFSSNYDFEMTPQTEYAYSMLAKKAGINVPEIKMFYGERKNSFFGIKRFDRGPENSRHHIHTFGNLIHSDFRVPSADYNDLLKVTRLLTKSESDVIEMFRRMIFNIIVNNRDDHVKNFSFIYDTEERRWKVAPAYDLTFSEGPGGEHSMTVNGRGKNISREDVIKVAEKAGLDKSVVNEVILQINEAFKLWKDISDKVQLTIKRSKELESVFVRSFHNLYT